METLLSGVRNLMDVQKQPIFFVNVVELYIFLKQKILGRPNERNDKYECIRWHTPIKIIKKIISVVIMWLKLSRQVKIYIMKMHLYFISTWPMNMLFGIFILQYKNTTKINWTCFTNTKLFWQRYLYRRVYCVFQVHRNIFWMKSN